jgi:hypothetical protein
VSCNQLSKNKNLRKQITSAQVATVILFFTLPQVVFQISAAVLQPPFHETQYNNDKSTGRCVCSTGEPWIRSIQTYAYAAFVLLVLALLCLACATRTLPSLFNETSVIFNSTVTTLVIVVLGSGIIAVSNDPTTTPAIQYLVKVMTILSITLQTSYRIMMPKLRMIWNGETVVVSKLVFDHSESVRIQNEHYASKVLKESSTRSHQNFLSNASSSGRSPSGSRRVHLCSIRTDHSNSQEVRDDFVNFTRQDSVKHAYKTENTDSASSAPDQGDQVFMMESAIEGNIHASVPNSNNTKTLRFSPECRVSQRHLSDKLKVSCGQAPPRRLLLKMIDLQEHLSLMNNRVMSGVAVSEDDWIFLREMNRRLFSTFKEDVMFAWESDEAETLFEKEDIDILGIGEDDVERFQRERFDI